MLRDFQLQGERRFAVKNFKERKMYSLYLANKIHLVGAYGTVTSFDLECNSPTT
jgi:hypothetical protein